MPTDEVVDEQAERSRERRLRRRAEREGLRLAKSPCRILQAPEYGTYHLVDVYSNCVVALGLQSGFGLSLDEVEAALDE